MRPVTMVEGFAMLLKSSSVSDGLLIFGSTEIDLSQSFPSSLISPGFSSRAGGAPGSGCCCGGAAGTDCSDGDCRPSEGGAACGQAGADAINSSESAAAAPTAQF